MKRLLHAIAVLIAGAATIVIGTASPASASVVDIACAGSQTVTYSPGLTLTPTDQAVSVTTNLTSCVSLTQPDITSGQSFAATNVPGRTCLSPLDTDTITVTITWNTGQTSTYTANRTVTDLAATILVTYTGTITTGAFTGSLFAQVNEYPNILTITCALTPLTNRTGLSVAEITSA